MWDEHFENGENMQGSSKGEDKNRAGVGESDDAMEFEKRIDDQIQDIDGRATAGDLSSSISHASHRRTTRKPEDVKFRTFEEERASIKLQNGVRQTRKSSVEERISVDSFEFLGLIGQGSYGKVFMAKKKKSGKFYAIKMI